MLHYLVLMGEKDESRNVLQESEENKRKKIGKKTKKTRQEEKQKLLYECTIATQRKK